MIIRYCRSSMCMGDDAMRGIYTIQMPDNATLGDLIGVLLCGGNGNDWPVPQTSVIGWTVYSDIGRVADVSADQKLTDYHIPAGTGLAELQIAWVYAERSDKDPDIRVLARLFE